MLFALQTGPEAGGHFEEFDDLLGGCVMAEDEGRGVVGVDVASDVLVGGVIHQVPGQTAGLSQ